MKIKNGQLNELTESGINKIIRQDIPILIAWVLKGIIKELRPILDSKEELRVKIVEDCAKKDKDGKFIKPKDEKTGKEIEGRLEIGDKEKYKKKLEELNEIETEVEIKKIKLKDIKNVNITTEELMAIDFIFEE